MLIEVDVEDGLIAEVRVAQHQEDSEYFQQALVLIDKIVEDQSVDQDVISGATLSSDGIITGARRALLQAVSEE